MLRDPMSDVCLSSTWMNLTHGPDGIRTCSEAGIHIPDTFLGTVSWAAGTPHAFEWHFDGTGKGGPALLHPAGSTIS